MCQTCGTPQLFSNTNTRVSRTYAAFRYTEIPHTFSPRNAIFPIFLCLSVVVSRLTARDWIKMTCRQHVPPATAVPFSLSFLPIVGCIQGQCPCTPYCYATRSNSLKLSIHSSTVIDSLTCCWAGLTASIPNDLNTVSLK